MLDDFLHSVLASPTVSAVQETFRKAIVQHGYSSSAYRTVASGACNTHAQFIFRNWSKGWTRLSEQKGLASKSFVDAEAPRRGVPFTWHDLRRSRPFSADEDLAWQEARAWGWRDGFVVPIHGPRGHVATVTMASMEPDLDLSATTRLHLQVMALCVHERCGRLRGDPTAPRPIDRLSDRELECLRWVAAGKTDWEIGKILSISAHTAKFHVDGARIKLDARTRAHAVARLLTSQNQPRPI
jgi:DNA-binding CsgD family transcriptional regulator